MPPTTRRKNDLQHIYADRPIRDIGVFDSFPDISTIQMAKNILVLADIVREAGNTLTEADKEFEQHAYNIVRRKK